MTTPTGSWEREVRTIEDARRFVADVGVCTIFADRSGTLPSLWDAVDAPDKRSDEPGWGERMSKVWIWKNELPTLYPNEIYYGKLKGGRAILCTMPYARDLYRTQHRSLKQVSATARDLYDVIQQGPIPNRELRYATGLDGKAGKYRFDRALMELQVAMLIVRSNQPGLEHDTWLPLEQQYPHLAAPFDEETIDG